MLTSSNSQRGNVDNQTCLLFDVFIFFFSTEKTCQIFPPPRNGALVCMTTEVDLNCAVMCSSGTDFEDTPPLLYYCAGGEWNYLGGLLPRYKNSNPWPNCSCKSFIRFFVTPLCSSVAVNSTLHSVRQFFHTFKTSFITNRVFFHLTERTFFLA